MSSCYLHGPDNCVECAINRQTKTIVTALNALREAVEKTTQRSADTKDASPHICWKCGWVARPGDTFECRLSPCGLLVDQDSEGKV